ncbi:MAG: SDR family NAD(P)-dependent oxidoreductase, partial [Chloroflexota bacterium]
EATAYMLAHRGATVIGIGRNPTKIENSTQMIKEKTRNPNVDYLLADLSSQQDIRAVAQEIKDRYDRLDVMINNAGATFPKRLESVDGIEMTFALNHLGYFLLTTLLFNLLEKSAPARIVNVSSSLHRFGDLDLDDIAFLQGYSRAKAYQRSKLANIGFTYELSRRISNQIVTVNAMNPGLVATNVGNAAGGISAKVKGIVDKIAGITPEEGARTIIYLATSLDVAGVTGKYFVKETSVPSSKKSYDLQFCHDLWNISESLTSHI